MVAGSRRPRVSRRTSLAVALLLGLLIASAWRARPGFERWLRLREAERAIAEGKFAEARVGLDLLAAEKPGDPRPRFLLRPGRAPSGCGSPRPRNSSSAPSSWACPSRRPGPEHDLLVDRSRGGPTTPGSGR